MIGSKSLPSLLASLVMVVATGCAPAYHSYSGCRVNCRYCPRAPLPYTHYDDCVCHSCAASRYLSKGLPSVSQENHTVRIAPSRDDQASAP